MESIWLAMAKRLQAVAQTGQQFTACQFDQERYQEIEDIAGRMLALLGNVPLQQVQALFATGESGYVTPKVEVRGAVIRAGQILLVQEKEDDRWAMPGGYADVGLSAKANVEKEVWEEAGLTVHATHLYALRHKASGPYPPDPREFYKLHFICQCDGVSVPSPGPETRQARFFDLDQLPPLSAGKNHREDIEAALAFVASGRLQTFFD